MWQKIFVFFTSISTKRGGIFAKASPLGRSRNTVKTSDSAIGKHYLGNPDCAKLYNDDMFQIIGKARSSFHLAVFRIDLHTNEKPAIV